MTVGELQDILSQHDKDMPVGLVDAGTDDLQKANYSISKADFFVEDYVKEEGGEVAGKGLFLSFENKRAPDIFNLSPKEIREHQKSLDKYLSYTPYSTGFTNLTHYGKE